MAELSGREREIGALPKAYDIPDSPAREREDVRPHLSARVLWASRPFWLGLISFLASLVGTLLLADEDSRAQGELLLAVAGVLAVIAWGGQRWSAPFAPIVAGAPSLDRRRLASIAGICAAGLVVWWANSYYLDHMTETFGLAGWLWLAGMALLVGSALVWPRTPARRPDNVPTGAPPEVNSSLQVRRAGGMDAGAAYLRQDASPPAWHLWEIALLSGLFALALFLRLWDLQNFPFMIHPDEVITGRNAIAAYMNPGSPNPSVFSTVWDGINLPALWFVFVGWSLKVGGLTLAALRVPAALFGAATTIPFYGMVRGVWGRAAAIGGTAILAFSMSNVHFSRVTINNIDTQLFWAACLFFLLRGLRSRRPSDWAMAGIAGGLSEYFYYGTRLLPILLAAFMLYLLVIHFRQARHYVGHFALLGLGYIAGFGPLLAYYTRNPSLYLGRGAQVLTWNHIPASWDDLVLMWNTLWPLMSQNLLGMSTLVGQDSVYFGPLLMPVEAGLLALGFGLLVWRWRHPGAFLMLLVGVGVLVVGGTLVPSPIFIAHWTPAFPAFYAAIAVPLGAWASWASSRKGGRRQAGNGVSPSPESGSDHGRHGLAGLWTRVGAGSGWKLATYGILTSGLLFLAWQNIFSYFNSYYAVRPEAELRTSESRLQASLGADYRVRNIARTWEGYDPETNKYLLGGVTQDGAQTFNPGAELPLPGVAGKGIAFFFREVREYEVAVRDLYPGGTLSEVKSHGGVHLFNTYTLTPEQEEASYGAYLQLFDPGGTTPRWTGRVPTFGSLPGGVAYPLEARWSAGLYWPQTGSGRLDLMGGPASVLFDTQPDLPPQDRPLQAGWHRLQIEATLNGPTQLQLLVTTPGAATAPAHALQLWPALPGQGLLGAVAGAGQTAFSRIDTFIGFTWAGRPDEVGPGEGMGLPLRGRWVGEINAPVAGPYRLDVHSDGQASLLVDGRPVYMACPSLQLPLDAGHLQLTAGWHQIQLDYLAQPDSAYLELYWTPPGEERTIVPPSALRYAPATGFAPANMPVPPESLECKAP